MRRADCSDKLKIGLLLYSTPKENCRGKRINHRQVQLKFAAVRSIIDFVKYVNLVENAITIFQTFAGG